MKRTQIKIVLCAGGLAFAATAGFAQVSVVTPATPTARSTTITTATTSPIVVPLASGATVVDIAGAPVGRIENIVMSPVGCAEAALVASTSGRIIPVPWSLVRATETTATTGVAVTPTFAVAVEQARLMQAPSFTRATLPNLTATTTWLQPSVQFFNVSSTTTTRGGVSATGAAGTSSSTISGSTTDGTSVSDGTATGSTGTGSAIGGTAAGTSPNTGSTATGAGNQDRFGSTATRTSTNSSAVLPPPTGRPIPTQPGTPPTTPPATPNIPATPDANLNPPSAPATPPSGTATPRPATPPPAAPQPNPPAQP